jgi:hypothetical protein
MSASPRKTTRVAEERTTPKHALIRALGAYMLEHKRAGFGAEDFIDFAVVQLELTVPHGFELFSAADWYEYRARKLRARSGKRPA